MKNIYRKRKLTLLGLLMAVLLTAAGLGTTSLTAKAAGTKLPAVSAQTVGPNTIKVSWTGVTGADGYRIYQKDGNTWKTQGDYKSTTRWVNVWGLKPDTQYTFTVAVLTKDGSKLIPGSYDPTGASAYTASAASKPAETKPEETKPAETEKPSSPETPAKTEKTVSLSAPSISAETVNATTIKVSWKGVKKADGYRIYVKKDGKWVKQGDYKSTTRWVKIGSLKAGTKYAFTVRAYAKNGSEKIWGKYDKTGVSAVTMPASPSVKAQTVSRSSIKVSWKGVTGADGYRIYMKKDGKWVKQGDYKSTTRWVKINGLKSGTKYTFTVRAYAKSDSGKVWGSYNKTGVSAATAK
ncbi:MAG: fibronectin type III domain-containing protein [Lachnospiraceae bacterium]|nr:fibronectin type III domain-containing protein [Lachnospiraceae bacterium]MDY4971443.1 fibronectin type III domain-containing protein [Lachnospiraceae bacterium]